MNINTTDVPQSHIMVRGKRKHIKKDNSLKSIIKQVENLTLIIF